MNQQSPDKGREIASTDVYTSAWEPSEQAFITIVLPFEDLGAEEMGFHQGWGQCADQLTAILEKP